jgi:magnesium transporter
MENNTNARRITRLPGELVHIKNRDIQDSHISIEHYSSNINISEQAVDIDKVFKDLDNPEYKAPPYWINIDGLKDLELLQKVAKRLKIHSLSLEDVLNINHRPKIDFHKDYIYISLKMIDIVDASNIDTIRYEQISFFIFPEEQNLLTIQEYKGDVFNIVRKNIREEIGKVRSSPVDYLMYRLIDIIVDHYSYVTEILMNTIEELESQVGDEPNQSIVNEVQRLRSKVIKLKKEVFPVKDIIFQVSKDDNSFLTPKTITHFNDVNDHIISIIDNINSQKEALANLMVIYQTNVSFKMNQVISVLTILSVVFIPLTFVSGLYGMNFKYMPELEWKYGYVYFWSLITIILVIILFIFKKKKWI